MLSCKMRLTLVTVIAYYSVGFQHIAATVLYPNGQMSGDTDALFNSGTGFTNPINWKLPFLGQIRNSLKISKDGVIVFDGDLGNAVKVLATTLSLDGTDSHVWWRLTNDAATLSRVTQDFQPYYSTIGSYTFKAKWALIVTWYDVIFPQGAGVGKRKKRNTPAENTFQLVLATDGLASYAMFNYQNFLSGEVAPFEVGFFSTGNVFAYVHPLSSGELFPLLMTLSNVGVTGRWIYRVDGRGVLEPDCVGFSTEQFNVYWHNYINKNSTNGLCKWLISSESGMHLQSPVFEEDPLSGCVGDLLSSTTTATSFLLVPCNVLSSISSAYCVSIVPVFAPNMFARHGNYILNLCPGIEDTVFKMDSSFIIRPNTFKNGFFALQSSNFPDNYVQFKSDTPNVMITVPDSSVAYNSSASFTLGILPSCPSANKATWCSTIESSLCSQAPFDVLCRATCDALTAMPTTTTTTQPKTTTKGVVPLKLKLCARLAYRKANPQFCRNWVQFNRRFNPLRWSNRAASWAVPRAAPRAGSRAGRRFPAY